MAEEAVRGESSSSAANGNGSPSDKPKRKRSRGGCYTCRRRKVSTRSVFAAGCLQKGKKTMIMAEAGC